MPIIWRKEEEMFDKFSVSKNNRTVNPPVSIVAKAYDQTYTQYNLCGIVTHIGRNMEKGHYVSEVKYRDSWFKCNDSIVSNTSYQNLSKNGYGFMFERN